MNWKNLQSNKCPKCGSPLKSGGLLDDVYACSSTACEFAIGKARFDDIINDMYRPKARPQERDNMSDLNNMGHDEVTEDFSDSPFL